MAAEVPADGPVRLGAVQLPEGKRISEGDGAPPRLWATRGPVRDAGRVWQALSDMHPDIGLVPILLAFLNPWADWGRPWDNGELGPRCDLAEAPELLSAVLRSWEDRFGAVLVEVGFNHIRLLARRPPRTLRDAQAVAAELWPICSEFWPIDRPGTAVCEIGSIAECILDIPIWSMWWD